MTFHARASHFQQPRTVRRRLQILVALSCCLWAAGALAQPSEPSAVEIAPLVAPVPTSLAERVQAGKKLARNVCASCHLFPEPDLLDQKTWREQTLPRMQVRLGLSPGLIERHPESALIRASGLFPESPVLAKSDWILIVEYYLATAPETALPQDPRSPIQMGLKWFRPERPKYRHAPPMTTLVKIGQGGGKLYVGDAELKTLETWNSDGSFKESFYVGNIPVAVWETPQGVYLTSIGHFIPAETPKGELIYLERTTNGFNPGRTLLSNLPRSTDAQFADLNGDGKTDFVLSMFGNHVGRLAWFENKGNDDYKEHVLMPKPGAVRSVVHDLNGDGFPDIAVLMAQDIETFLIYYNDGKGSFTPTPIFQQHPAFGHASFELADFNRDGRMDILTCNGDNGEYASPLKKYHGVRVYLNLGANRFEQRFFYPLNGAFQAVARDFDEDGDLDITAVSFFPDYEKSPQEGFVYFDNEGDLRFSPSTFQECISGRWLTLDAGDLDGDRDIDLVLGSYARGPTEVPERYTRIWEQVGPSALILRNRLR